MTATQTMTLRTTAKVSTNSISGAITHVHIYFDEEVPPRTPSKKADDDSSKDHKREEHSPILRKAGTTLNLRSMVKLYSHSNVYSRYALQKTHPQKVTSHLLILLVMFLFHSSVKATSALIEFFSTFIKCG